MLTIKGFQWELNKFCVCRVSVTTSLLWCWRLFYCHSWTNSNSIWPHLSYGLVRSKREYCH